MLFVGQLYAEKSWFPLDGNLCLHLYSCHCHPGLVHLEILAYGSALGYGRVGRPHPKQNKKDIHYEINEDPLDRSVFWGVREYPDLPGFDPVKDYPYLYEDKIGGLFPYDAYEGPMQTKDNQMIAQMGWSSFAGTVYLYHSTSKGFYPHHLW